MNRVQVTAAELHAAWMSTAAVGLTHDYSRGEIVVRFDDGRPEVACGFDEVEDYKKEQDQ